MHCSVFYSIFPFHFVVVTKLHNKTRAIVDSRRHEKKETASCTIFTFVKFVRENPLPLILRCYFNSFSVSPPVS